MSMKTKLLGAAVGLASIAGLATGASASTSFLIGTPGVTLSLGSGWGSGGSLFGADWDIVNNLNNTAFVLNPGGSFVAAGFASVTIQEENIDGPPGDDETNNLGVTFTFNFDLPGNGNVNITTTGVATPGPVDDAAIDLIIDFSTVNVAFGVGGLFQIIVSDVIFNNEDQFQPITAEIRLVSDSQNVPEPMTLGLLGAGLLGMGIAARRRRS